MSTYLQVEISETAEFGVTLECKDAETADEFEDFLTERCFVLFNVKPQGEGICSTLVKPVPKKKYVSYMRDFCPMLRIEVLSHLNGQFRHSDTISTAPSRRRSTVGPGQQGELLVRGDGAGCVEPHRSTGRRHTLLLR
jgi:hypothetical protein